MEIQSVCVCCGVVGAGRGRQLCVCEGLRQMEGWYVEPL